MRGRSDNEASIALYRSRAAHYDATAAYTMPLRLRTIALLRLQPGEVVLDAGAGTGLSYAPLLDAVGAAGRVLAFEQSPDMHARAVERVAREGWRNVWQAQASAESVRLPQPADAALFNYVHDLCRTPQAVANVMCQLKPGARIAIAGMKFFPWWAGPLNLLPWLKNRPYNMRAAELWRPWDIVQAHCDAFEWQATQWGMGYIGCGRLKLPR